MLINFRFHSLDSHKIVFLFIFSDRFRTAINVFGDSIGCAIVEHLSRKELDAIDNKTMFVDSSQHTLYPVIPLLESVHPPTHPSNHVSPNTYDNPTFSKQADTLVDEEDNSMAQTSF